MSAAQRPNGGGQADDGGAGGRCCIEGLLLAPGAGAGRDQPGLVAIDAVAQQAGIGIERMDFPYRLAGRRAPDRLPVLVAALVTAAGELAARLGVARERVALGGRSMGGRVASVAVADGLPAAALVLVSYPLHPPGQPDRLRTEHFPRIEVPCLFVSGSRDAFGTPEELARAIRAIPSEVTHVVIEGADHGLARHVPAAATAAAVGEWLADRSAATCRAGQPAAGRRGR